MKLTWFGGSTFRIQIGGQIIVTDAAQALPPVDLTELRSGADIELRLGEGMRELPEIAPGWQPPRLRAALDAGETTGGVEIRRLQEWALLVSFAGESPLLLATGTPGSVGRWSRDAVVVACGGAVATTEAAVQLVEALSPRLLALAAPEPQVAELVGALRDRLGDTALVALEPAMALEA